MVSELVIHCGETLSFLHYPDFYDEGDQKCNLIKFQTPKYIFKEIMANKLSPIQGFYQIKHQPHSMVCIVKYIINRYIKSLQRVT